MKITLFTGNQPRHLEFARKLSVVCDELFVVQECSTLFPGEIRDYYDNSDVMNKYFSRVRVSEKKVFGNVNFLPKNVYQLSIRDGDLDYFNVDDLGMALLSDIFIVYGSSYIKGEMADYLINKKAINLHMGISPYYRGNSSNFWALYYNQPEMVGATIMRLSKRLDDGAILFHCFPRATKCNGFDLGMLAVQSAQIAVVDSIKTGSILNLPTDNKTICKPLSVHYTKLEDFTDTVVTEYLMSMMDENEVFSRLNSRKLDAFVSPRII